jgi:uncharacterized protein YjbI with pentapeptide repeats
MSEESQHSCTLDNSLDRHGIVKFIHSAVFFVWQDVPSPVFFSLWIAVWVMVLLILPSAVLDLYRWTQYQIRRMSYKSNFKKELQSEGINLAGQDLRYRDFTGMNLRRSNFSGANMMGCRLNGCNLEDACLNGTNLTAANLTRANLSRASLVPEAGEFFRPAILKDAILMETNFTAADLSRADLSGAKIHRTTNFQYSKLIHAHFGTCPLRLAVLVGVDLSQTDLREMDFSGANLERSVLKGADMTGADLTNARCRLASDCTLRPRALISCMLRPHTSMHSPRIVQPSPDG